MRSASLPQPTTKDASKAQSDALLLARLESRYQKSPYSALRHVSCDCYGGVAVLTGRTPTYFQKQMAQTIALNVDGIGRVVNHIEVDKTPARRRG